MNFQDNQPQESIRFKLVFLRAIDITQVTNLRNPSIYETIVWPSYWPSCGTEVLMATSPGKQAKETVNPSFSNESLVSKKNTSALQHDCYFTQYSSLTPSLGAMRDTRMHKKTSSVLNRTAFQNLLEIGQHPKAKKSKVRPGIRCLKTSGCW